MASRVALVDKPWVICSAPYHLIRMAIEMACKAGVCFSVVDFVSCITGAKRQCYGQLKIKPSYDIVRYFVLIYFLYYGSPPKAINAVLAIIAGGGQAIDVIYREGLEIYYVLLYFIDYDKTLQRWPRPTPCEEAPRGLVCLSIKTMPLDRETAHHGGDVCVMCV